MVGEGSLWTRMFLSGPRSWSLVDGTGWMKFWSGYEKPEAKYREKKYFHWSCSSASGASMCLSLSTKLILQREILPSLKLHFTFLRDSPGFESLLLAINFRNLYTLHPCPSQQTLPARFFKDSFHRGVLQADGNCMPASLLLGKTRCLLDTRKRCSYGF